MPTNIKTINIYRYNEYDGNKIDTYKIDLNQAGPMVLDILNYVKENLDHSLAFRKSCREGVCGSCSMNIDGENTLACTKKCNDIENEEINIYPLPHMHVEKDLVVDLENAFKQYASVKPWLINDNTNDNNNIENIQSIEDREKLNGHVDCILCFCCSTSCPSYWWNGEDGFLGPATLLQVNRFIKDSRDTATEERLNFVDDEMKLYRCHTILNCTQTCPKGLNPAKSISEIKRKIGKE